MGVRQRNIHHALPGRITFAGHGPALALLALLLQSSAGGLTPPLQAQVGSADGVELNLLETHPPALPCCAARHILHSLRCAASIQPDLRRSVSAVSGAARADMHSIHRHLATKKLVSSSQSELLTSAFPTVQALATALHCAHRAAAAAVSASQRSTASAFVPTAALLSVNAPPALQPHLDMLRIFTCSCTVAKVTELCRGACACCLGQSADAEADLTVHGQTCAPAWSGTAGARCSGSSGGVLRPRLPHASTAAAAPLRRWPCGCRFPGLSPGVFAHLCYLIARNGCCQPPSNPHKTPHWPITRNRIP